MDNICIPMHLDAFALSPDCCDGPSNIAPFTQPNYAALRLDSHYIQQDVLDHTDFHSTCPANKNPRLADIGADPANNLKPHRMGIHLHWSLPRCYRSATASGRTDQPKDQRPTSDTTNPVFPLIPNRWLVTRHLKNFAQANVIGQFQSWVIESDVVRKITDINDGSVDLESDVSPFVSYSGDPNAPDALNTQTEIFLGQKFDLAGWAEDSTRTHTQLTIMNSSNPLFADYALHNPNVLSIIDSFPYKKGNDTAYLADAQCDYYVIGWHQDPKNDLLNQMMQADLNTRLSNLLLQLSSSSAQTDGLKTGETRSLCFGAIYDVNYNQSKKPQGMADEATQKFTSAVDMEPLSVGTTALDGILTFLEAHKKNAGTFFGQDIGNIADDLLAIAQLLYASADEYDSRVQAQDLIVQQNFAKAAGGFHWTFAKKSEPGGTPATPTPDEVQLLSELNEAQSRFDVATRKLQTIQWELFAEWWKYVSELIPATLKPEKQKEYIAVVDRLKEAAMGTDQKGGLRALVATLKAQIADLQTKVDCKQAAKPPYYTRTDPTLCIAGLDSGWPDDFLDNTTVLLDHELASDTSAVDAIFSGASNPIPTDHGLQATAKKILAQCLANFGTSNGIQGPTVTTGFQAWGNRNPFIPMFIEWESLYYHIDKASWDVELRPSPVGHPNSQIRYGTKDVLSDNPANLTDVRSLNGRFLILPQPTFNLETIVLSVLNNAPPDIQLSAAQIAEIKQNIRKIKFISAPLSGLTDHLLTRCAGAHVKPNLRTPGQVTVPLATAITASNNIHIDGPTLELIDTETALTPYGNLIAFSTDQPKPFKPVTHGQMLFTKLNIIDKFGQAICLPSPKPRLRQPVDDSPYNIFPCLSDYLAPNVVNGQLNTVRPLNEPQVPGEWPLCKYMQLTPSINQDARINAAFLIRDVPSDTTPAAPPVWREATDFEQPVFGWIIINYADYGLQFFLADGTFYCEVRKGGPTGVNTSAKWLPYGSPPKPVGVADTWQLDQLIGLFSQPSDPNGDYLEHFFEMINGSIQNMPFPPSDYSGFANAIVGKPLALVNAGWSLELSTPAIKPQNSLGAITSNPEADLEAYSFPLKIGDINRTFDGVVGYYVSSNTPNPTTDWSKLYTYFVPNPTTSVLDITPEHFPLVNPYYLGPETTTTPNITSSAAAKYLVTTLLIDPYTPLHAYSPILPTTSLQLPAWTIQSAFNKMQAFFHLGPSLVTVDVPPTAAAATGSTEQVKLPVSGHQGLWNWLQPYAAAGDGDPPQFVELGVQQDDGRKFESAPYTFLEGYLQLVGKLGKTDVGI